MLIPFPCILYSLKFDRKAGLAIVAVVACTLAFVDRYALLLYLFQSVACSLLLPELLSRGKGAYRSMFYSVAANVMLVLLGVAILQLLHKFDFDGQIRSMAHAAMTQAGEAYRKSGVSGSDLQMVNAALKQTEDLLVMLFPALSIVFLWFSAGCNVLLLKRFSVTTVRLPAIGRFSSFRNPDALVWVLIVSGFALLADVAVVDRLAMNALAVLFFLYLLQGFAVAAWLVRTHSRPRLLKVLFFAIVLLLPHMAFLGAAAVGLIDLWADFRAPKQT